MNKGLAGWDGGSYMAEAVLQINLTPMQTVENEWSWPMYNIAQGIKVRMSQNIEGRETGRIFRHVHG